jgi:hypothetical protein
MKLSTDIKPRKDGTVKVTVPDGTEYKFSVDGDGQLSAEVANADHIGFLLDTGNFYPVEEDDIDAGLKLVAGGDDDAQADDQPDGAVDHVAYPLAAAGETEAKPAPKKKK